MGSELQMFQNIGQVVSKETARPVDSMSAAHAPLGAMPKAVNRLWQLSEEREGAYPVHRPQTEIRSLPPPRAVLERQLLRGEHQSGLPLSWDAHLPAIPVSSKARSTALGVKRVVDVVLALLLIVLFSPVFLFAVLAIKLGSKGPALFQQDRVGFRNDAFRVYKFRTMYTDRQDLSGVQQTTAEDARITPIGRVLRKTSVDELPQIINILKGEMSFVGPRPHVAGMLAGGLPYEELVPYYDIRHLMKPGLTGWAQANGFRGPTIDPIGARARVDHDIAYIQNFSIRLDLVILVKTAWREFVTGTGI
jgi:lipopolysaccharide/colanic/teichoic acid biosynthesis glycosyltransferase